MTKASVPIARLTDPETSHEAAESVWNPSVVQAFIYYVIDKFGPVSDEEIAWHYGHAAAEWGEVVPTSQSLRSRRAELVKAGKVEFADMWGLTATGRRTRKWVVAA